MEVISLKDENTQEEEERESASGTADEILSFALQSKSALRHVFTSFKPRKRMQGSDKILQSANRNDSVARSNSLKSKSTPSGSKLRNSVDHSSPISNHQNDIENQSHHSQVLPSSISKIVRSISTPEISSKFIIPMSNTKTDTHRRIDFSGNKQKKEDYFHLEKRGMLPQMPMKEYFNCGRYSKFSSSGAPSKESEEALQFKSFSDFYPNRNRIRKLSENSSCKEEISISNHRNTNLNCDNSVNDSLTAQRKNKIGSTSPKQDRYFPKVVPLSGKIMCNTLSTEATALLHNCTPKNSTAKKDTIQHPYQPSPSPSLALKISDVITVNQFSYFILREFGKGGSSIVYEAFDIQSRQRKAIKAVYLEGEDEVMKKTYRDEIQILRRLQYSPRIIKLFDHEETPTRLKIVMEAGEIDLSKILLEAREKKNAPIPAFSIQHYWQGMLLAVQVIHQEGIIHSDLKPANFLLVNGTLKLIDFGIASSVQQDMTSVFKDIQGGTYNYMSPESLNDIYTGPVINGNSNAKSTIKINVKSDVWSLGCILYNLVYGKTPFQHLIRPLQKLSAIANPATAITFPPITDKNLLDVMQKCLQFDAYKRPSIKELLCHPYVDGTLTLKSDNNNRLVTKVPPSTSKVQSIHLEGKN